MSAHAAENLHIRWFTGGKRTDIAFLLSGIKTGRLHIINTNSVWRVFPFLICSVKVHKIFFIPLL